MIQKIIQMNQQYTDDSYIFKNSEIYEVFETGEFDYLFEHPKRNILIKVPKKYCDEIFFENIEKIKKENIKYSYIFDIIFRKKIKNDICYIPDKILIDKFRYKNNHSFKFPIDHSYKSLNRYKVNKNSFKIEIELRNYDVDKDTIKIEKLSGEYETESVPYIFVYLHLIRKETEHEYFSRKIKEATNTLKTLEKEKDFEEFLELSKKYISGVK